MQPPTCPLCRNPKNIFHPKRGWRCSCEDDYNSLIIGLYIVFALTLVEIAFIVWLAYKIIMWIL
jgi:hypothetical protein